MSAAMSSIKTAFVIFILIKTVFSGKYKPVEVEIKTNEGGEPLKIFTAEELAKYDGTDVYLFFYPQDLRYNMFYSFELILDRAVCLLGKYFFHCYNKRIRLQYLKRGERCLVGAHALWSLDEKRFDSGFEQTGLDDEQLEGLDGIYTGTYLAKYPIVGYMDFLIAQQSDDIKKRFTNEL
ncbi:uncharacterized protein LOC132727397 [Ruditapes philippinarum]|uniref:uncharacterized protein LOC132727397 n=1 Tax=Ruditapes philippinarum TaxID=129788 RepID=UPI00295B672C|nr:uncharacterized protein LOC132727397 [Ruditapes philippinarum]